MALAKDIKTFLDQLSDEEFLDLLAMRYGSYAPVWEECSQEEYENHMGKAVRDIVWDESMILRALEDLCGGEEYRAVALYNEENRGLLWQMENHEPDGWRYEKKTGTKFVLTLGGDMMDYCMTRECMKPYFDKP